MKKINDFFIRTILVLIVFPFGSISQTTGALDTTFNPTLAGANSTTGFLVHAIQADGKIIIGGSNLTTYNGTTINGIARLNVDGTLDSTFNSGTGLMNFGTVTPQVRDIKIQADGKILLCGVFGGYNGVARQKVMRLNTNGTLDTTFNVGTGTFNGGYYNGFPYKLLVLPNNQILVSGDFWTWNSASVSGLIKLNTNGTRDASFTTNSGTAANQGGQSISDLKLRSDGTILVTGSFLSFNNLPVQGLVLINASGTTNTNFPQIGLTVFSGNTYGLISSVDVDSSNNMVVVGNFYIGGVSKAVARLNPNGTIDSTFSFYDSTIGYSRLILRETSTNKYIIHSHTGTGQSCIVRVLNNGSLDNTFNLSTNVVATSSGGGRTMLFDSSGRVVFSGFINATYGTTIKRGICRLSVPIVLPIIANSDTGTAISGTANSNSVGNVRSNDTYNGATATSLNTTLSFVSSTNPGITLNTTTGSVSVAATVPAGSYTLTYQICAVDNPANCTNGTVTISVSNPVIDAINNNFSSTPISYITGGSTSSVTSNDLLNGVTPLNSNLTITLINNGGLVGSTISNTGIITIPAGTSVGTFNLTYQICQTLNPTNCDQAVVTVVVFEPIIQTPNSVVGIRANNLVDLIDIQTGGKIIIGGAFTTYNNIGAVNIARLNTDLTLDTSFTMSGSTPASNNAFDMAIQNDNKIVLVGQFTGFNGGSNGRGIIRLNADGTVDTSFNSGGTGVGTVNDRVRSCAIQSDGKILLGGSFITSYNGTPVRNMIRLNSNGTLDSSFVYPYGINALTQQLYSAIFNIVVQPDGKILVAGIKNSIAGGQPTLFRLNSDGTLDSTFTIGDTGASTHSTNCTSCSSPIQNIVLQPDGKILIVGSFDSYNGNTSYKNIVRLLSNGAIDVTFNGLGSSTNRVIKDLELEPATGKMYIAGEFTTFNGASVNKIIRLNSNGSIDTTFNSGTGTAHTNTSSFVWNAIHDLKRQGDGKVILGGLFTSYNGVSALNITRIQPTVAGGQARMMNYDIESSFEVYAKKELITNKIAIYPNPSSGIFKIDMSGVEDSYKVEIYSIIGSMIYQQSLLSNSLNEIDLSRFQNGYYLAKIYNNDDNVTIKLMKN